MCRTEEGTKALIASLIEKGQCYCELNNGNRCSVCPSQLDIHNAITALKASWPDNEFKKRALYDPSRPVKEKIPVIKKNGNLVVDNAISLRAMTKNRGTLSSQSLL